MSHHHYGKDLHRAPAATGTPALQHSPFTICCAQNILLLTGVIHAPGARQRRSSSLQCGIVARWRFAISSTQRGKLGEVDGNVRKIFDCWIGVSLMVPEERSGSRRERVHQNLKQSVRILRIFLSLHATSIYVSPHPIAQETKYRWVSSAVRLNVLHLSCPLGRSMKWMPAGLRANFLLVKMVIQQHKVGFSFCEPSYYSPLVREEREELSSTCRLLSQGKQTTGNRGMILVFY